VVEPNEWIKLLHKLLAKNGILFISIDDEELHYLKVICDEVFGRRNYVSTLVWEKKKKPSFLSNVGSVTEYILCYSKQKELSPNFIYGETTLGKKYPFNNAGNGLADLTFTAGSVNFKISDGVIKAQDMSGGKIKTVLLNDVQILNGVNANDFTLRGEWRYSQKKLNEIIQNKETILISQIPFRPNHLKAGGEPKKMKNMLSISHYNISTYEDSSKESIALFGDSAFDYPKPEMLIQILIEAVTDEGDIILDSFLGSGTTAAVASKTGRKWIGIELGEHAQTHCFPRLKAVVDGEQGGISKAVDWQGGGGFKFYNLAPSLLNEDKYGNWIISKEYNAQMLASAVAKQEGFKYEPNEHIYWKQGMSSEKDFIFTTTQFITAELMDKIHEEMQPGESLLIACKSYQEGCENRHTNISIKKIPHMLMGRCEFGKDDYSFNIVNMPIDEDSESWEAPEVAKEATSKKTNKSESQPGLFDNE